MPPKSNKPTFFLVDNESNPVWNALEHFKKTVKGKRVLYIELTAEDLSHIPEYPNKVRVAPLPEKEMLYWGSEGAYRKLAFYALINGLHVIPLDKKRIMNQWWKISTTKGFEHAQALYQSLNRRENDWSKLLRNANGQALVVMHPGHGELIMRKMHVPKNNIAYCQPIDKTWIRNARRKAAIEARRVTQRARIRRAQRVSPKRIVVKRSKQTLK